MPWIRIEIYSRIDGVTRNRISVGINLPWHSFRAVDPAREITGSLHTAPVAEAPLKFKEFSRLYDCRFSYRDNIVSSTCWFILGHRNCHVSKERSAMVVIQVERNFFIVTGKQYLS